MNKEGAILVATIAEELVILKNTIGDEKDMRKNSLKLQKYYIKFYFFLLIFAVVNYAIHKTIIFAVLGIIAALLLVRDIVEFISLRRK